MRVSLIFSLFRCIPSPVHAVDVSLMVLQVSMEIETKPCRPVECFAMQHHYRRR
jgi:hypothetical protein